MSKTTNTLISLNNKSYPKPKGRISNSIINELEKFLESQLPEEIAVMIHEADKISGKKIISLLDHYQLQKLMPEDEPALQLNKAAYIVFDSLTLSFATCSITEQMCLGYFPFAPVLPLATAAQYASQAGELLITSLRESKEHIPVALQVINTRYVAGHELLFPGDNILFVASHQGGRTQVEFVEIGFYNQGIQVGGLDNIIYGLTPISEIVRQYQEHLEYSKVQDYLKKSFSKISIINELEEFLAVEIPDELVGKIAELQEKNMVKKVDFLNHNQINNLIPEEPPALNIDKAVLLGIDGNELALCTTRINEQMCQGHFSFAPALPLATVGQQAAQVGEVLINSVTNQNRQITHAVLVTEIRARRNKVLKKDFLFPGDDILYIASYKGQKNDCECALTEIYNKGALMGILKEIDFRLMPQKSIQDQYQNRLTKHVENTEK